MNIYHFQYFTDAVRLGSLSASASKNRISHSAVSQSVRSLEKFFGVELLHHKKRGFEVTESGKQLFEELNILLNDFEALQQRLADADKVPSGPLSIMAPQSMLVRDFFGSLKQFRKQFPKVNLKIRTGAALEVRRKLEDSEVDLGVLIDDGMLASFQQELLKTGRFVVVGLRSSEVLGEAPLIVTQKEKIEVLHLMKNFELSLGKRKSAKAPSKKPALEVSMEALSWTLIKELILQGYGHGYLPDYLVRDELKSGKLHQVKVPGLPFEYQIKAIWKKHLTRSSEAFLEMLKQEL